MTAKVERVAGPLRWLVARVADGLRVTQREFWALYAPRVSNLGFRLDQSDLDQRAAWAMIAQWLAGYASGALDAKTTLAEAEEWFLGRSNGLPRIAPSVDAEEISELVSAAEASALLPYLLDPLAPGTRRCVLNDRASLADRLLRKTAGIYYTPADLAQRMADSVEASRDCTCLDPACGSGVFLRSAYAPARAENPSPVFGYDIDPLAAEQCAFVLLAGSVARGEARSPWATWHLHRLNLATIDSLLLEPGSDLSEVEQRGRGREVATAREALRTEEVVAPARDQMPRHSLGALFPDLLEGADVLLCNPPYARLGAHPAAREIGRRFASFDDPPLPASEISSAFVEHAWRLTKSETGRAVVVVPLSVAFSSARQFRTLRRAMAAQPGRWKCAFFDRAPDALFGDDVKTRNAVLTYEAGKRSRFKTTSMLRWTSRTRGRFLRETSYADIGRVEIDHLIPKLGSNAEAQLYRAIRSLVGELEESLTAIEKVAADVAAQEDHESAVYVAPTAYNWLNCVRSLPTWQGDGDVSASPFTRLRFADSTRADAAYGLLSSRLVFWLWRVEGDAFHVPQRFLRRLPFALDAMRLSDLRRLAVLGAQLWNSVSNRPVISVNKGKLTLAFPPSRESAAVDAIDEALLAGYGLSRDAREFDLPGWYERMIIVDLTEKKRLALIRPEEDAPGA